MKKLLSGFLCLLMVLSMMACAFAEETTYPEYLNLESTAPIVKDEFKDEVVVDVMMVQDATAGNWDDVWQSTYLWEKYNLKFDVTSVLSSALSEKKSLMFASGDMPTMMWNIGLSTAEIMRYGQQDQLLYPLDTLISEELTPHIYEYIQRDDVKQAITTPDGHIYTLPKINETTDEGSYWRVFMNVKVLEEMGYELPKTLDEFNEILYAFKEKDANNVPIGNYMNYGASTAYILNAFGYTAKSGSGYGDEPAMRNGEVVIPAYDMDTFKEYLKLMNQYYNDGIINQNYFTMENTEAIAQLNAGQNIFYGEPVYVTGYADWADWEAPYPLTSEWNETAQWPKPNFVNVGNFALSAYADLETAQLCMRIADLYFAPESRATWVGAGEESGYMHGYVSAELSADGHGEFTDTSKLDNGLDLWTYLMQDLAGIYVQFGAVDDTPAKTWWLEEHGGTYEKTFDLTNPDQHYRWSVYNNMMPYGIDTVTSIYYLTEEENDRLTDLTTLIKPYIQEQVALFITGERSLDETDAFVSELESMGIQDLLEIYKSVNA